MCLNFTLYGHIVLYYRNIALFDLYKRLCARLQNHFSLNSPVGRRFKTVQKVYKMKVIILIISAVSVVLGGHAGYPSSYSSSAGAQIHPQGWQGDSTTHISSGWAPDRKIIYPQHVPVIHNGVPVETPEVQAAKAHFYHEYARSAALAAQKPDPLDGQYAGDNEHGKYLPVSHGWTAEKRLVSVILQKNQL